MKTISHKLILGCTFLLSGVLAPGQSEAAANWQICNRTAETMWVAIAFDPGNGRHVSQGWWKLAPCGGCASVGSYSVRGVWYHAHNQGSSRVVEGNDRFCTNSGRFRITNQVACRRAGAAVRGFTSVALTGSTHTSNINGRAANGRVCID